MKKFMGVEPSSPSHLPNATQEFMEANLKLGFKELSRQEKLLEVWKIANGPKASFDENAWKELNASAIKRDNTFGTIIFHNHMKAAARFKNHNLLPAIAQLAIPFLVIEGGQDPIFPIGHGAATINAAQHGQLITIDNMGHAMAPEFYDEMVNAIIKNTN
jgi:pimeloyl-ACP methyl ester carboxylesterase